MKWIRRIVQFLQEQADGRRLAPLHDLFAAEKHLADGIGFPFHRQLLVDRVDELGKLIVDADDFLTFDHGQKESWKVGKAETKTGNREIEKSLPPLIVFRFLTFPISRFSFYPPFVEVDQVGHV